MAYKSHMHPDVDDIIHYVVRHQANRNSANFSQNARAWQKLAASTLEIVRKLVGQPIVGVAEIMKWTGFTAPGAYKIIKRLKGLKILEPFGNYQPLAP